MNAHLLTCPNCGAPLERTRPESLLRCQYCGAQVEAALPSAPPPSSALPQQAPPWQPTPQPATRSRGVWFVMLSLGIAALALAPWLVSTFLGQAATPSTAPNAAPATATAIAPKRISLSRLATLDIALNLARAKTQLPSQFPEMVPDMHQKAYSFEVEHPLFRRANLEWDWGCDCLDTMNLFLKDYPTELAAPKTLVPCLVQKLGALTSESSPPFHYYWKVDGIGNVSFGSSSLFISPKKGVTTQAGFRHLLSVVDECGSSTAPAH